MVVKSLVLLIVKFVMNWRRIICNMSYLFIYLFVLQAVVSMVSMMLSTSLEH